MTSLARHSAPPGAADLAHSPGRDLRPLVFSAGFLLPAFCAGMASYALVKESRRGWAGILYARSGPLTYYERFQVGLMSRPVPGEVLHVESGGPAERAGVARGDVVRAIGGRVLGDSTGLRALAERVRPGDVVSYRLARGGTERTAHVRLESALHARRGGLIRYSTYLLVGMTFLGLGVFVYARRPTDARALLFYLLSACAAIPFVLLPSLQAKSPQGVEPMFRVDPQFLIGGSLAGIAGAAFGALLLHFALIFPRPRPIVRSRPFAYAPGAGDKLQWMATASTCPRRSSFRSASRSAFSRKGS